MGSWFDQVLEAGKAYLDYDVAKTQASQSTNKAQTNAGANGTAGTGLMSDPTFKKVAIFGGIAILVIGGALAVKRLFF